MMRSGRLAYEYTGLTHRDILVGVALSLPRLYEQLTSGTSPAAGQTPEHLVGQTFALLAELQAICEPAILRRIGYGLEKSLADSMTNCLENILVGDDPHLSELRRNLDDARLSDDLLDIWQTVREMSVVPPSIRQAAFGLGLAAATPASFLSTKRSATSLSDNGDPVSWEIASRLRRMDIVLVDDHKLPGSGVVLGSDVSVTFDEGADGVTVQVPFNTASHPWGVGWSPVELSFSDGLKVGAAAAKELLRRCGILVDSIRVTCTLRGVLPPNSIHGESAGLALALRILAEHTNLPLLGWLPSGSINSKTLRITPMSPDMVKSKHAAMTADGVNQTLLVHCDELIDIEGVHNLTEPTLDAAAFDVWGERWTDWSSLNRRRRLDDLNFLERPSKEVWAAGLAINGEPVVIEVPQVRRLSEHFERAHPTYAFLGGPVRTGKSWIAEQVAKRLKDQGWHTITLTPTLAGLPSKKRLRDAVQTCLSGNAEAKTLVVFDDIEWETGREGFEEELQSICDEFYVNTLTVIRSDDSSDWKLTGSGMDCASIINNAQITDFIERLSEHPAFEADARTVRSLAGAIKDYVGRGDIWLITRLADLSRSPGKVAEKADEFFKSKIDNLSHGTLENAKALAALSIVGLDAPNWLLPNGGELADIGVYGKGLGRWVLPSRIAARAILRKGRSFNIEVPLQLGRFILQAMDRDEHPEVIRLLKRLWYEAPEHLTAIFKNQSNYRELERWALLSPYPDVLAQALDVMSGNLRPEKRGEWARHLVNKLIDILPDVTVSELATSLTVLHDQLHLLERQRGGKDDWDQLMETLPDAVGKVLDGMTGDSYSRLQLLRAISRLHEDKGNDALRNNVSKFLKFSPPFDAYDYKLTLEFIEIEKKLPGGPAGVAAVPDVETLANMSLPEEQADTYIARLILRETIGASLDWETDLFPQVLREFPNIINRSSPRKMCYSLALLAKFNRPLAISLLNQPSNTVVSAINNRFSRLESGGEMADLLFTINNIHARTARHILYLPLAAKHPGEAEWSPRLPVVEAARRAIINRADAKGIGRLLKAALKVDNNFGSISDGFSRRLVDALGRPFFIKQCEWEPRTSVLFYLLEGLVEVEAPFLNDIVNVVLDAIKQQIDANMKPWAPRLALLLMEYQPLRDQVFKGLVERLTPGRLIDCMSQSNTIEALGYFHRLGTALFQDEIPANFSGRFTKNPDEIISALLAAHRPEVTIRAARAVGHTLRRGGVRSAGEKVLEHLAIDWKRQLERARTPGDLAETIRGLTALNQSVAAAAIKGLLPATLEWKVSDALARQPQVGAELLDSIEDASPGVGRKLATDLARKFGWDRVMREIAHEQDPRAQGTTFHMLARHGAVPTPHVRNLVFNRWKEDIRNIISPASIVVLLRALASWNISFSEELAGRLSIGRLRTRIKAGVRQDLEWVEALVGVLTNLGRRDMADELLEALPPADIIPNLLGSQRTAQLLTMLYETRPDIGQELAESAVKFAVEESRRQFLLDDTTLLFEIGWLAFAARRYGLTVDLGSSCPWVYQLLHYPSATLWGCAWLKPHPWTEDAIKSAFAEIETVPASPAAQTTVILTSAKYRTLEELFRAFPQPAWAAAFRSSLYSIEGMLEVSRQSKELALFINKNISVLLSRLSEPHERLHPALPRIKALLTTT